MNKYIIPVIATVVVAGGCGFFGGIKYNQHKTFASTASGQNFQNMTPEQRQAFGQQFRNSQGGRRGTPNGGGFIVGEILSKDDKSITIKMRDGGSKIIFFSATTAIAKTTETSAADLEVGKTVQTSGQANSDGSITAQSIQIRLALPANASSTMPTNK